LFDNKKQCAELGAANVVKVEGLDIRIEALEKEARGLRKQLRAQEETDANAEAEEMACLAMQQVADAQAEVAEMKQTNITLEKLVSRLQGQLNADQPDLNRAIIEALEQQNSATIVQLAEAVDEMLSMKSTVLHHQRKAECLQKQIDDAERMKDRIEAEHMKILEPIASSIPPEPIFSMPVYGSYKSKPALLAFSMIITVESLPVNPTKKVSFATSMTISGVTAIDTEPMESLTSFEDDKPILISVQITPSNPARWSLMTKIRAVVSSNVPIDIHGPDKKTAQDFQQALYDTAAVYDKNIALVASKQKLLVQQFQEIEQLKKRSECTVKEHQAWKDELQAACQLNELNNLMLQQQGDELQLLKKMREKEIAATVVYGHTERVVE